MDQEIVDAMAVRAKSEVEEAEAVWLDDVVDMMDAPVSASQNSLVGTVGSLVYCMPYTWCDHRLKSAVDVFKLTESKQKRMRSSTLCYPARG